MFSSLFSIYISYGASWENLITRQDVLSLVIISLIFMTCVLDQVVILLGGNRCLSLLGFKGVVSRGLRSRNTFKSQQSRLHTVFSRLKGGGVYLKLGLVDPAFIRGPAFIY